MDFAHTNRGRFLIKASKKIEPKSKIQSERPEPPPPPWTIWPLVQILAFVPVFAPRPHMGSIARMDPSPKTTFKMSGGVLAAPSKS